MKIIGFAFTMIMIILFLISSIIPSASIWVGGVIGIIVLFGVGCLSAKLIK